MALSPELRNEIVEAFRVGHETQVEVPQRWCTDVRADETVIYFAKATQWLPVDEADESRYNRFAVLVTDQRIGVANVDPGVPSPGDEDTVWYDLRPGLVSRFGPTGLRVGEARWHTMTPPAAALAILEYAQSGRRMASIVDGSAAPYRFGDSTVAVRGSWEAPPNLRGHGAGLALLDLDAIAVLHSSEQWHPIRAFVPIHDATVSDHPRGFRVAIRHEGQDYKVPFDADTYAEKLCAPVKAGSAFPGLTCTGTPVALASRVPIEEWAAAVVEWNAQSEASKQDPYYVADQAERDTAKKRAKRRPRALATTALGCLAALFVTAVVVAAIVGGVLLYLHHADSSSPEQTPQQQYLSDLRQHGITGSDAGLLNMGGSVCQFLARGGTADGAHVVFGVGGYSVEQGDIVISASQEYLC